MGPHVAQKLLKLLIDADITGKGARIEARFPIETEVALLLSKGVLKRGRPRPLLEPPLLRRESQPTAAERGLC
jgi:hypothetical protein